MFWIASILQNVSTFQARNEDFSWETGWGEDAYLKNPDEIINNDIIGHASAEDRRFLGGSGDMFPQKTFEI